MTRRSRKSKEVLKWCTAPRFLNGVAASAKRELASPNGPRPLCHLPLSSTDRHGRLVDYHQDCKDDDDMCGHHNHGCNDAKTSWVGREIFWSSSVVFHQEIQDLVSGNGFNGDFYHKMESDGLGYGRPAPTSLGYASTRLVRTMMTIEKLMMMCFVLLSKPFLWFFLGGSIFLGAGQLLVVCKRSMGVCGGLELWWMFPLNNSCHHIISSNSWSATDGVLGPRAIFGIR